jgi:3'(2'),5'-bisphosphate nucleotidase
VIMASKIFGIGLSKTGTTSLANALQILGYKTKDNMGVVKYATGDLSSVDLHVVDANDALTDTPVPSFYRGLDTRYSGSKFILTVRDAEGWLKSCKKQFTQRFAEVQTDAHKRLFTDLYGTDAFDDQGFARGYERFVNGAREYFKDRQGDFLIIDIAAGEGWEKLCPFLEKPVPDIPFPKANVTQVRWMSIEDVVAVATQAGLELMRRYDGEPRVHLIGDDAKLSHSLVNVLQRAVETVRGEDRLQAAIRAAHGVIVKGLTKLTPQIPVLSRARDLAPHTVRKEWNHVWLVDPLDGEEAFVSGSGEFSINIALIEDGQPIYGVVYAPATGATYYAKAGKGAYRRAHGSELVPLTPSEAIKLSATDAAQIRGPAISTQQGAARTSSYALAMCKLSEGPENGDSTFQTSMEWQTAAAHAILTSAGKRVCDCESERELGYNKKTLSNSSIKVT